MRLNADTLSLPITILPMEIVKTMADGNPGAMRVMFQFLEQDVFDGIEAIRTLDRIEIYGPDIWFAYKDICGQNVDILRNRLRNNPYMLREEVRKVKGEKG